MNGLEPKHYALLGAFLVMVGTEISGLKHGWPDAISTSFIGGLLGQLGLMIGAMYVGAPGKISIPDNMAAVGNVKPDPDAIRNPSRLGAVLLACALAGGSIVSLPACGGNPNPVAQPVRPPEVVRAQQAGAVIQRIGEFQQAVIDGQQLGKVKTEDARVIVTWTVAVIKRLKEAPAGWAAVALAGWQDVRPTLLRDPNLSIWVGVVDELLKGGL